MSSKGKVIAVAIAFTVVGFMLNPDAPPGRAIFGSPADSGEPTGGQIAALMVVGALEAVAFGLGVALLVFGLPAIRKAVAAPYAIPAWLTLSWFLVSWVPHTALHRTAGHNVGKLIGIEYAFHVTLVLGGALLTKTFLDGARAARRA